MRANTDARYRTAQVAAREMAEHEPMDVPISRRSSERWSARRVIGIGGALLLVGAGVVATRYYGTAVVSQEGLWTSVAEVRLFAREVRGVGRLVPSHVRLVSPLVAGRVERIHVSPGAHVEPGTVIVELENPDVRVQQLEAARGLSASEATVLREQAADSAAALSLLMDLHETETEMGSRRYRLETLRGMRARDFASEGEVRDAEARVQVTADRLTAIRQKLALHHRVVSGERVLRRKELEQARDAAASLASRAASLRVLAADSGVLEDLRVQLGQWVNPGELLARIARADELRAVLRVSERDAQFLRQGLGAWVAIRQDTVPARVSHVDAAVRDGTVEVELRLTRPPPSGAQSDLSITGGVLLEEPMRSLVVARPANAIAGTTITLFRLSPDGSSASVRQVRLGRLSAQYAEVLSGLQEGDRVVVSDMSSVKGDFARIR